MSIWHYTTISIYSTDDITEYCKKLTLPGAKPPLDGLLLIAPWSIAPPSIRPYQGL